MLSKNDKNVCSLFTLRFFKAAQEKNHVLFIKGGVEHFYLQHKKHFDVSCPNLGKGNLNNDLFENSSQKWIGDTFFFTCQTANGPSQLRMGGKQLPEPTVFEKVEPTVSECFSSTCACTFGDIVPLRGYAGYLGQ